MKRIIALLFIVNLVLVMAQLLMSAKRATDGDRLAQVATRLSEIEAKNQTIKDQIYQQSALSAIQDKASALQLTKVAAQFINLSQPVARAQ